MTAHQRSVKALSLRPASPERIRGLGGDSEMQENPPPDSDRDPNSGQEPADSPATNEEVSLLRDEETLANAKEEKEEEEEEEEGAEEEEVSREPKRRRTSCPSAIDACAPVAENSVGVPPFSFDTKIQPMYLTPKFGSFSVPKLGTSDLQDPASARSPEGAKEAKGEAGIGPDTKPLVGLGSADGGHATKDER